MYFEEKPLNRIFSTQESRFLKKTRPLKSASKKFLFVYVYRLREACFTAESNASYQKVIVPSRNNKIKFMPSVRERSYSRARFLKGVKPSSERYFTLERITYSS